MRTRATSTFTSITTEGALLPADLLRRIAGGDESVEGLSEASYHLTGGEKLGEAISRSWTRLTGAWAALRTARERLPESDLGTTLTRDRWLLPFFQELGYGRLGVARGLAIDGVSYPVSHLWQNVPIHLVSFRTDLDTRTSGVAGAARRSPHSLVQEFLNKSDDHLWGFVSNGLTFRILRDNVSLTRQAYVEFDLVAMFEGDVYSEFTVLWLLAHQSRVEAENPADFWLETWSKLARDQGVRALDQLRVGVEQAIQALGSGFLAHPANSALKERLRAGTLDKQDYYRQLLRLVYRLLFLFVAEDRDVLLVPETPSGAKSNYRDYYSTARLRQLAVRRRGTRHGDLWEGLRLVMDFLGRDDGCPSLGLPALGSFLFSADAIADLARCALANRDLLVAIRALSVTDERGVRRQVDFRNLRSEELGSVYEALLEQHPSIHAESATFELRTAAGHERKTTGSYYTPDSLVQSILDSALEPVLAETLRKPDPERAILNLKVCDPACGSGHFLVAAAHRIAKRLASVRTGDDEPSPEATRHALRDVISRCIYGVDLNPMAVELCKVALWMEAIEPSRPLSFLDHHVKAGNSILHATPALIEAGLPNEAFEPLGDDDVDVCRRLKRRNAEERNSGQFGMLLGVEEPVTTSVRAKIAALSLGLEDSIEDVRSKESALLQLISSEEYRRDHMVVDAWTGTFFIPKRASTDAVPTTGSIRSLAHSTATMPVDMRETVARVAAEHAFFQWPIEFPDVFVPTGVVAGDGGDLGWVGGFDVVLGNPPWELLLFREQEYFAGYRPDIAEATTQAVRRRLIEQLAKDDPVLYADYLQRLRDADAFRWFCQESGRYPLTGRGRTNTYALFAELMLSLTAPNGRVGCIVPSGIVTDDSTKEFFQHVTERKSLASFFDFENREGLFPAVDSRQRFGLMTLSAAPVPECEFVFYAQRVSDLTDAARMVRLSDNDIALLNPNTRTCPILRNSRERDIALNTYEKAPVLVNERSPDPNGWGVQTRPGLFNMSGASSAFRSMQDLRADGFVLEGNVFTRDSDAFVPLYEGKMFDYYDHRAADVVISKTAKLRQGQAEDLTDDEHKDHRREPMPRHWVSLHDVRSKLGAWKYSWVLGWKEVTAPTNARTLIPALLPAYGIGHKIPLIFPRASVAHLTPCLAANLGSLLLDFITRVKLSSTSLTPFTVKQLPILLPTVYERPTPWDERYTLKEWIFQRVAELSETSVAMTGLAADLGFGGQPFRWDPTRREHLRAELDAAFFHLYGTVREDVLYILDSFTTVRRREEASLGEYRTKRLVVEMFDAMFQAINDHVPYRTALYPPPASDDCRVDAPLRIDTSGRPVSEILKDLPSLQLATPPGVSPGNLILFAALDVLRTFPTPADPLQVRNAIVLATQPALAAALMTAGEAKEWVRVVGPEARPLPPNVAKFSSVSHIGGEWANVLNQLKASGALHEDTTGMWQLSVTAPTSGQPWLAGRAQIAFELVSRLNSTDLEQNLVRFVKDVEDGKTSRAVS